MSNALKYQPSLDAVCCGRCASRIARVRCGAREGVCVTGPKMEPLLAPDEGARAASPLQAPSAIVTVAAFLVAGTPHAAWSEESSFQIYGFAQGDWIQDNKRVDPNWLDAFRPSKIATPEGEFGTNGQASLSAKQTRFGVKGFMPTGENTAPLEFKFEIDMFGVGAEAGRTTVRLRHAYGEWGHILGGQTHSLFMDIDVFPNVIDYWGPPGMVFLRTPQLRWTALKTDVASIAVAVERPSNDIDPGNVRLIEEYANATVLGDQKVPDLTAQYRMDATWGHAQLAAILRSVGYEYQANAAEAFRKGHQTGWGVNLSGALKGPEKDQLLLQAVYGHGIASYMNDGGMDIAPTATYPANVPPTAATPLLSAEAVPLLGVVAYYDHYWNAKLSTSLGYSFTKVDNTNFQEAIAFHRGDYASINLLAYPADNVMFGAELMWGRRMDNDGVTGHDYRLQVSAKYNFGVKL